MSRSIFLWSPNSRLAPQGQVIHPKVQIARGPGLNPRAAPIFLPDWDELLGEM
jgi:hypothetical protein